MKIKDLIPVPNRSVCLVRSESIVGVINKKCEKKKKRKKKMGFYQVPLMLAALKCIFLFAEFNHFFFFQTQVSII